MARPDPSVPGPGPTRGIALVLVLWVLTLLTVMAMGMTAAQRTELSLTENRVAEARLRALGDAAIAYTVLSFLMPLPEIEAGGGSELAFGADAAEAEAPWLPNGTRRDWAFAGSRVGISVTNEQSRIDLNRAEPALLGALMVALGVPEEEATAIGDAIADWRDDDDLKLLNGAEDPDYESAGRPIGAKDGPFVAVEELQQVLGMTRELYLRLAPELTVDSAVDRPDPEFASAAVLAAIQGIDLEEAQQQILEREGPVVPGAQRPRTANRGGPLYRLRIEELGSGEAGRAMEALVELASGQDPPYQVRWRRYGVGPPPPPPLPPEGS
jgi:general secretion pathway protein K